MGKEAHEEPYFSARCIQVECKTSIYSVSKLYFTISFHSFCPAWSSSTVTMAEQNSKKLKYMLS